MPKSKAALASGNVKRRPKVSPVSPDSPSSAQYEPEHSERQVNGSIKVAGDAYWFATLSVAMTGEQSLLVTVERKGPVLEGTPAVDEVTIVIPAGEEEAVLTLLRGLVVHARRDGVLGP